MEPGTLNFDIKRGVTFGGVALTCRDKAGGIVPLAGWKAYAQMRKSPEEPVLLDFLPQIAADDAVGLVTIPPVSHTLTAGLENGVYFWDLILENPSGRRFEPSLSGSATVTTPLTQPGHA